ncbi:MAG: hypothetical protein DRQ39_02235 [Gammaproteobacteria bacterium]|nr:MAG: hypothetical protein DRQ39_02235 [Gammaproteobacteria bacterium]
MAAKQYTTSVTVQFTKDEDSSAILTAEVDGRPDGMNNGNTQFVPGIDDPVILIFKSAGVVIDDITTSIGNLTPISAGAPYKVGEGNDGYLIFANERSKNLSYPNNGGFSSQWFGTVGGAVTATETQVSIPTEAVAVLKASYTATYVAYRLNNVPLTVNGSTEFPVVVFIAGHTA